MKAEKINTGRNIEEASLATEKGRQLLAVAPPNPEVQDKAVRRRFTAEYKLRKVIPNIMIDFYAFIEK